MFNLREIIKKLQPLLTKELNKRATYKDVAKALDIPYNRFRQQIYKNTIPFEEILIFCFKRKISINYLFFNQLPETLIRDTDHLITLRYNSVLGSLGYGLINYELEPISIVLDKYLLDFIKGSYYDTELITGYGDSMEPFIQDGSLIFIDKSKNNLINNKIYVFLIEDRLYIKQYKKDKNLFISFNKSYPAVENNKCKVIGKVIGVLTKF